MINVFVFLLFALTSLISIALNTLNAEQISLTAHFCLSIYHPYFYASLALSFRINLARTVCMLMFTIIITLKYLLS